MLPKAKELRPASQGLNRCHKHWTTLFSTFQLFLSGSTCSAWVSRRFLQRAVCADFSFTGRQPEQELWLNWHKVPWTTKQQTWIWRMTVKRPWTWTWRLVRSCVLPHYSQLCTSLLHGRFRSTDTYHKTRLPILMDCCLLTCKLFAAPCPSRLLIWLQGTVVCSCWVFCWLLLSKNFLNVF